MLSSREALSKLSKLSKLARQEHQAAQQAAQQAYQHGHPGSVPVANVEGKVCSYAQCVVSLLVRPASNLFHFEEINLHLHRYAH